MKEKYLKVLERLDLPDESVKDVNRAICCADYLFGDNPQSLDYDLFVAESLPEVQMMRVYVDTLLICIGEGGYPLTCPSSEKVARLSGHNLRTRGYADADECIKIMDDLVASGGEFEEAVKVVKDCLKLCKDKVGEEPTERSISLPKELKDHVSSQAFVFRDGVSSDGKDITKRFILAEMLCLISDLNISLRRNSVVLYSQLKGAMEMFNGSGIKVPVGLTWSELLRDKALQDFMNVLFSCGVSTDERLALVSVLNMRKYVLSRELFPEYLDMEFEDGKFLIGGEA